MTLLLRWLRSVARLE